MVSQTYDKIKILPWKQQLWQYLQMKQITKRQLRGHNLWKNQFKTKNN